MNENPIADDCPVSNFSIKGEALLRRLVPHANALAKTRNRYIFFVKHLRSLNRRNGEQSRLSLLL
jgi:hypothetical protein